jgi:hypothetical protein
MFLSEIKNYCHLQMIIDSKFVTVHSECNGNKIINKSYNFIAKLNKIDQLEEEN